MREATRLINKHVFGQATIETQAVYSQIVAEDEEREVRAGNANR